MEQKIYGRSENGNIVCLGIRLEDGSIGNMPCLGGRVNNKLLVGNKVVFYNKEKERYYDINVLSYIESKNKRFVVKYQDEEEKEIFCGAFIKNCKIKNVINEKTNKFYQKENYWVMTIPTKNTKHEKMFNGEEIEVLFDGTEDIVRKIINSKWHLWSNNKQKNSFYIETSNFNKEGYHINLHQVVFGKIQEGNVINHIKRTEDGWKDNRLDNLEEVTKKENAKNKAGAGYPQKHGKKWIYKFSVDGYTTSTPPKEKYEEVNIDALIVQKHFNFGHRVSEFYLLENIEEEYKRNIIEFTTQKLINVKNKGKQFTKNKYVVEKDGDKEIVKIFDNVGNYCIIDIEDLWILDKGRVAIDNRRGYSKIYIENNQYMLHRYILGIKETNLHGFQVDHKSINPYDNTKENLIITTIDGNLCNRKGKGYRFRNPSYLIQYNCYWEYISKHDSINKLKHPSIMNEQEAKEEVFKRKWLANYIRPQFKSYEEYLEFKSTCPIDDLDKHWIETKFPNINKIEIPKYEENKEE